MLVSQFRVHSHERGEGVGTIEKKPSRLDMVYDICMAFPAEPVQGMATADMAEQSHWPELMGVPYEQAREVLSAAGKHPQMAAKVCMRRILSRQ